MTTTKTTRGFKVTCPFCVDEDAVLFINLADVSTIHCPGCDAEFSAAEAREKTAKLAAQWEMLASWLEDAPEISGE